MKINDERNSLFGISLSNMVHGLVYEEYACGDSTGEFFSVSFCGEYMIRLNDMKVWSVEDASMWGGRTYIHVDSELIVK